MRTLIDEDTTQNDMPTILQDLSSKSQGSEGGEGRKGGREEGGKEEGRREEGGKWEGKRRKTGKKMLRRQTKVTLI